MLNGRYREFAKIVVITVFFLIIGTFIAAFISYLLKEQQVKADAQKLQELYPDILEGTSTGPTTISVNFSEAPIAIGSPHIFGGSHGPNLEHQDAWDAIAEIGVTSIRKDFFPENALPGNITLEDYKNNKNGIQDIDNWNQDELKKINSYYVNAHQRGMQTIGIVAYAPKWLTYSNTIYGVPRDWQVYKDIVKKTYRYYRNNLDYVEIWNEPSFDFFLNLENSNLSREEAYKLIFKTAVEAIREVDAEMNDGKKIKIGGPVSHRPFDTSVLEIILKDTELKKELDFISYHNYESEHLPEPSDIRFRSVMDQYGVAHLPVFLTEWNYSPGWNQPNEFNTSNAAITYTGRKFLSFLEMGLGGANYHVLEPLNPKWPNGGEDHYGFYRRTDSSSELLPQSKTWRLLSKQMKLGEGESRIYRINTGSDQIKSIGLINIDKQYGVALVNDSSNGTATKINFLNSELNSFTKVKLYYASPDNDAKTPVYEGTVKAKKGNISLSFYVPAESVVGITLTHDKEWFNNLPIEFLN